MTNLVNKSLSFANGKTGKVAAQLEYNGVAYYFYTITPDNGQIEGVSEIQVCRGDIADDGLLHFTVVTDVAQQNLLKVKLAEKNIHEVAATKTQPKPEPRSSEQEKEPRITPKGKKALFTKQPNRTGQAVVLENGKKHYIHTQVKYKKKLFFIVEEISSDEKNVLGKYSILRESIENGETYIITVDRVRDKEEFEAVREKSDHWAEFSYTSEKILKFVDRCAKYAYNPEYDAPGHLYIVPIDSAGNKYPPSPVYYRISFNIHETYANEWAEDMGSEKYLEAARNCDVLVPATWIKYMNWEKAFGKGTIATPQSSRGLEISLRVPIEQPSVTTCYDYIDYFKRHIHYTYPKADIGVNDKISLGDVSRASFSLFVTFRGNGTIDKW